MKTRISITFRGYIDLLNDPRNFVNVAFQSCSTPIELSVMLNVYFVNVPKI